MSTIPSQTQFVCVKKTHHCHEHWQETGFIFLSKYSVSMAMFIDLHREWQQRNEGSWHITVCWPVSQSTNSARRSWPLYVHVERQSIKILCQDIWNQHGKRYNVIIYLLICLSCLCCAGENDEGTWTSKDVTFVNHLLRPYFNTYPWAWSDDKMKRWSDEHDYWELYTCTLKLSINSASWQ